MHRTLLFLTFLTAVPLAGQGLEVPALRSTRGTLAVVGSEARLSLPEGVTMSAVAPAGPTADWLAAGTAGETQLVLVRGDGAEAQRIAPPRETAATVAEPLPVADERGRLLGLAWLAGPDRDRLAVRFATWEGDRWAKPMTVAPAGPGSQLALAAAARDGQVVLAWSSFDGQDDEILVSRRNRGMWSPPRPIAPDDATPDVTPALLADGNGFLLVWSGFEGGEYRLFSSRMTADRWSTPVVLGPPGSLFPSLAPGSRGPLLLFRDAHAHGWTVLALDAGGRTVARARWPAAPDAGPALLGGEDAGVRLISRGRETFVPWEVLP